jgi:hypothetical protein
MRAPRTRVHPSGDRLHPERRGVTATIRRGLAEKGNPRSPAGFLESGRLDLNQRPPTPHLQGWELTHFEISSEIEELRVLIAERKERHALTSRRA